MLVLLFCVCLLKRASDSLHLYMLLGVPVTLDNCSVSLWVWCFKCGKHISFKNLSKLRTVAFRGL